MNVLSTGKKGLREKRGRDAAGEAGQRKSMCVRRSQRDSVTPQQSYICARPLISCQQTSVFS